jgi:hypothetical protein
MISADRRDHRNIHRHLRDDTGRYFAFMESEYQLEILFRSSLSSGLGCCIGLRENC